MLKTRDFYLMKVYDLKGKYLGVVDDISLDFYSGKILGFILSSFSIFSKKNYIEIEDIVSSADVMIVSALKSFKGLTFKNIKYMDIIDNKGVMLGVLEDLIINRNDYSIKGFIISSGVIDRMFKGKEIILPSSCMLCEGFILFKGKESIKVKTLPHNIGGM